jgi:hypothetical protein
MSAHFCEIYLPLLPPSLLLCLQLRQGTAGYDPRYNIPYINCSGTTGKANAAAAAASTAIAVAVTAAARHRRLRPPL